MAVEWAITEREPEGVLALAKSRGRAFLDMMVEATAEWRREGEGRLSAFGILNRQQPQR